MKKERAKLLICYHLFLCGKSSLSLAQDGLSSIKKSVGIISLLRVNDGRGQPSLRVDPVNTHDVDILRPFHLLDDSDGLAPSTDMALGNRDVRDADGGEEDVRLVALGADKDVGGELTRGRGPSNGPASDLDALVVADTLDDLELGHVGLIALGLAGEEVHKLLDGDVVGAVIGVCAAEGHTGSRGLDGVECLDAVDVAEGLPLVVLLELVDPLQLLLLLLGKVFGGLKDGLFDSIHGL